MNMNDIPLNERKAEAGAARYTLLRTAQGILAKAGLEWKEQHRTCWCSRSLKHGDEKVGVYRNQARDGATFSGLNRCGNIHTCPVCAAKVAELRRKQLSKAMVQHIANGQTPAQIKNKTPGTNSAYLLTFTFPHAADETLASLMERFDKARQKFQNSKQWKAFQKSAATVEVTRKLQGEYKTVKICGVVNSLEFTISQENGWHPHVHMLLFCKSQAFDEGSPAENGDLDSHRIQALKLLWVETLFKCGLGDPGKLNDMLIHALNVRGGEQAAEYIAKLGRDERWGASSEMARSHSKIGAAGEKWGVLHFTPFQLLVWAEQGDGWSVYRFREFAEAVEGKRALVWAPNLKTALGVADVDEDEWTKQDEPAPEQIFVGNINADQYATLLSRKFVPQFLIYAATCANDQADLDDYIASIKTIKQVAKGALLVKKFRGSGKSVLYNF
jgi:plasmid rolling circle replication initiator protein Rep